MQHADSPPLPLSGIRILDLGRVVSGPFATQVLGDLGAEVVRVEQVPANAAAAAPGPLTEEEAFSWGLNRNKSSICVNVKDPDGAALIRRLAAVSDVVFDNFRPGVTRRLGVDRDGLHPVTGNGIITCSLTGFGQDGPWAQTPAYDPIVQAMSGTMNFTRRRKSGGAPVRWGIPIGDLFAGLYSCIGILAALIERDRSGQGQHVDVSMFDVMLALNTYWVPLALTFGQEPAPQPFEGGQGTVPYGTFRCSDGWLAIGVMDRSWAAACELIDRPDLVDNPLFSDLRMRQLHRAQLAEVFSDALRQRPAAEWEHEFLEAGMIAGRVSTVAEAMRHPQVTARGMAVEIADAAGRRATVAGDPLKLSDSSRWSAPSPRGADTGRVLASWLGVSAAELVGLADRRIVAGDLSVPETVHHRREPELPVPGASAPEPTAGGDRTPLAGFVVLELDGEEPSKAFAGQILADLGARVIRIDRPEGVANDPYPDIARESAYRCALNRNKQRVTADLKTEDGRAFVHSMATKADVVLDNYRPGVLERLGMDFATISHLNEQIVTCSITGFGCTGPWRRYAAYDAAIQALGGGQSITADHLESDSPVRWGNPIGGLNGSLFATIGVLAALRGRPAVGGRQLDVSLLDAQVALLSYRVPQAVTLGKVFRPEPRRGGSGALPFGVFPAARDTWFVLGVTQQFWAKFAAMVGHPEWTDDPRFADEASRRRNEAALNELVEQAMLARDAADWQQRFFAGQVPGAAVVTVRAAFEHVQTATRHMRVTLPDPVHEGGVQVAGLPVKLHGRGEPVYGPARLPGADTDEVRSEFLARRD